MLRQRDPAEREALAALHDGNPDAYLEHKAEDITIHATERDAVEAVVDAWLDARAEQPDADVVMIARDNATREQLNRAARARLRARGELSGEMFLTRDASGESATGSSPAATTAASTSTTAPSRRSRGYDRHRMAVQIQTDSGEHRWLDLHYLAHHVEHAYAITGHSSQGATVDRALVVGRPEEFTREWAYTALSRARTGPASTSSPTMDPTEHDRREYAPDQLAREPSASSSTLSRAPCGGPG